MEELPRLVARREALLASLSQTEEAYKESRDILTRWPTLSRENRRLIIEAVLERVIVDDDSVEFIFRFDPPPYTPSRQTGDVIATQGHGFIAAIS